MILALIIVSIIGLFVVITRSKEPWAITLDTLNPERLSNEVNAMRKDAERIKELVKNFIEILDTVEESDSGKEFHPVYISSCRVMESKTINEILCELRELTSK